MSALFSTLSAFGVPHAGGTPNAKGTMDPLQQTEPSAPNILVVDDTRANLRLLTGILTKAGYSVRPVPEGKLAILSAKTAPPDLILLDIMLPDMTGYEICEQLKAEPGTRDIPIIFISALHEIFDKVKAFQFGGVDYITKPFQPEEVLVRVQTHLMLRNLQKDLQEKNRQLEQEIHERKQTEDALRESEQALQKLNISKDTFFSIIAHDLKGPIGSLKDLIQMTEERLETQSPEQLKSIVVLQRSATENLFKLLENLLTWSRIQRGMVEYTPIQLNLGNLVRQNVELLGGIARQKQITLRNQVSDSMLVYGDRNMIDTVIRNLMSNALKFTRADGTVSVSADTHGDVVEIAVSDTGIGIAQEHIPKLFRIETKFKRLGTAREKGTGLGLILCREFVEQHQGKIWVESEEGQGAAFKFTLPAMPEE